MQPPQNKGILAHHLKPNQHKGIDRKPEQRLEATQQKKINYPTANMPMGIIQRLNEKQHMRRLPQHKRKQVQLPQPKPCGVMRLLLVVKLNRVRKESYYGVLLPFLPFYSLLLSFGRTIIHHLKRLKNDFKKQSIQMMLVKYKSYSYMAILRV